MTSEVKNERLTTEIKEGNKEEESDEKEENEKEESIEESDNEKATTSQSGAGLGFSFLRVSAKPQKVAKEEVDKEAPKKLVTGTNADLRKLPLKEARQMCREFGLLEEEISQLERWDVIDVIRTLSTQAAQGKKENL
uniref:DUF3591 domain-containing protein n=1 Tax=Meloidogyne hapla TaxID=6305 RepID=A0A1I8BBR2_MELHA